MPLPEAEVVKEAAVGEAEGPVVTVTGTETGRRDDDFNDPDADAAERDEEDDEAEDDKDQGGPVKGAWDVLSLSSSPRPWRKGVAAAARKVVEVATAAVEGTTTMGLGVDL